MNWNLNIASVKGFFLIFDQVLNGSKTTHTMSWPSYYIHISEKLKLTLQSQGTIFYFVINIWGIFLNKVKLYIFIKTCSKFDANLKLPNYFSPISNRGIAIFICSKTVRIKMVAEVDFGFIYILLGYIWKISGLKKGGLVQEACPLAQYNILSSQTLMEAKRQR